MKLVSKSYGGNEYSIHVVVVENVRIRGKPRQRFLKYLGAIRENQLNNLVKRREFLYRLENKIDQMKLNPKAAALIKVKLIRTIVRYSRIS